METTDDANRPAAANEKAALRETIGRRLAPRDNSICLCCDYYSRNELSGFFFAKCERDEWLRGNCN